MPYRLPTDTDAAAVPEQTQPDELTPTAGDGRQLGHILSEISDTEAKEQFKTIIDGLTPAIVANERQAEEEAAETVLSSKAAQICRQAGPQLAGVWTTYTTDARQVSGMRELSAVGRDERLARLRDIRIEGIKEVARIGPSAAGDRVLAANPAMVMKVPSSELASEATLILESSKHMTARAFISEALEALRIASDPEELLGGHPAMPSDTKARFDFLLHRAYYPVCSRQATHPSSYARVLQKTYGAVARLIERHLNTVGDSPSHAYAVQFVADVRQQFTALCRMAQDNNQWDDVMQIAAPIFAWG